MPTINENSLERVFSDLANARLRDKTHGLMDYLVGFQLIKQEEDGQRAVGIFGFEIDGGFYYAPVFFLNGEIRGLDSLYSVDADLFTPLTEDWINQVINKRDLKLGKPDTGGRAERGVGTPNYNRLKVVPSGSGIKVAEAMATVRTDEVPNLPDALNQAGLAAWFKTAMDRNPRLADAYAEFYSPLDLQTHVQPRQKVAEKNEPVTIISSIADPGAETLSDDQKRELLAGGQIVIDTRPEISKARVYRTETNHKFENPTGGGLYDMLWSDGRVSQVLIVPTSSGTNDVFVYDPESKRYVRTDSRRIFVVRKYDDADYRDWLEKNGTSPSALRRGDVATLMSMSGAGTGTFCISSQTTGVDGLTTLGVRDRHDGFGPPCGWAGEKPRGDNGNARPNMYQDLRIGGNGDNEFSPFSNRAGDPNYQVREILVSAVGAGEPRFYRNKLLVNDQSFRALVVNHFTEKDENGWTREVYDNNPEDRKTKIQASEFGDLTTPLNVLNKIAEDLSVWRDNHEVVVKTASSTFAGSPDRVLRTLMLDLDIGYDDAQALVKSAGFGVERYKLVRSSKVAAELLQLPEIMDMSYGGEMSDYHQQQIPYSMTNVAQPSQSREAYEYHSPFGEGDNGEQVNTLGVVEKAKQTGQRDVFDAAALASLIKTHTPIDLVGRFLPTVTAGMDRVGRMLFLIYWHYDEFEEHYGEDGLANFIDNLKSVFEQLGDVVLFAKQRSLGGDPDYFGMTPTQAGDVDE